MKVLECEFSCGLLLKHSVCNNTVIFISVCASKVWFDGGILITSSCTHMHTLYPQVVDLELVEPVSPVRLPNLSPWMSWSVSRSTTRRWARAKTRAGAVAQAPPHHRSEKRRKPHPLWACFDRLPGPLRRIRCWILPPHIRRCGHPVEKRRPVSLVLLLLPLLLLLLWQNQPQKKKVCYNNSVHVL